MRIYIVTRQNDPPPVIVFQNLQEAKKVAEKLQKEVGLNYKITEQWMIVP